MGNPIEKMRRVRALKNFAETFLGKKNFSWLAVFLAGSVFIVTGWLPDGIAELLENAFPGLLGKGWISGGVKTIVSLGVLLWIGFKLKKATKYKGKVIVKSEPSPYVKVLVVFLSPLRRKKDLSPEKLQEMVNDNALSKDVLKDALTETEWEMPVKAIEHQLELEGKLEGRTLKMIYVLPSKETYKLLPLFKDTIEKLFPNLQVKAPEGEGIDYQNIEEVFNSIQNVYDVYTEAEKDGYKDTEILVDVTSGQVTNSIAGAIATLSKGRKFQYVSTRDKKVLSYDVGYFEEETE